MPGKSSEVARGVVGVTCMSGTFVQVGGGNASVFLATREPHRKLGIWEVQLLMEVIEHACARVQEMYVPEKSSKRNRTVHHDMKRSQHIVLRAGVCSFKVLFFVAKLSSIKTLGPNIF